MGDFDLKRFQEVNSDGCADTTCGRSVIVNEDPCPDCCGGGGGGEGPPGPPGPQGPKGPAGPAGRPPLIRCGCLATNPTDGGSGDPIQQECIDNITGRVVMSTTSLDYFSSNFTSNSFFQANCTPTCGYFNVTNVNQANPALGSFTGGLGPSSTSLAGDKYIVSWGYIGTGNVPNVNYTWKYGDFKKINGLAADKLTATQGVKFTFMPTDSLFTGNGQIDLGGWKSLVTGTADPAGDLVAAFLNDFPQCATDGTGTPPGPKNGQGGKICESAGGECACEGCTADNQLQNCDDIAAGDVFIDACNKIMYIAGESGAFPENGIPFGPEDTPCPPKEDCPDCPDCPQPEPCGTCASPKNGQALQPSDWCNCSGALGTLFGLIGASKCVCPVGGALPKCPQECKKTDGTFFSPPRYYYQDAKKECPCNDDGDQAKCPQQCPSDPKSDYYQDATKECPCDEGKTDAGCQTNCAEGAARICPEDCPKSACDSCCPTCPPCDSCCPGGTHGGQQAQAPCTTLFAKQGSMSIFDNGNTGCDFGYATTDFGVFDPEGYTITAAIQCVNDDGVSCAGPEPGGPVIYNSPKIAVALRTCEEVTSMINPNDPAGGFYTCNSCDDGCVYYKCGDYYIDTLIDALLPARVSLNCDGTAFDSSGPVVGPFLGGGL